MAAALGIALAILALVGLFAVARGVAREQTTRRAEPIDSKALRAVRHEQRSQNRSVIRTMLLGRWATDYRHDERRGAGLDDSDNG